MPSYMQLEYHIMQGAEKNVTNREKMLAFDRIWEYTISCCDIDSSDLRGCCPCEAGNLQGANVKLESGDKSL